MLVGRHKDDSKNLLAALGLGQLTINLIIFSVVYTFNNALLTLVSQAFGQKNFKLCSTYLNRQIYLVVAIYIPQAIILYCFLERGFLAIGIDALIARHAAQYVNICLVGHLFLNISNCYQKWLSA